MKTQGILCLKAAFVGVFWLSLVLPGNATTFTVTSLADTEDDADGVVTLREAIKQANNQQTSNEIDCSNLTGTIDLVNDLPLITGKTRIKGSGITKLAISGACAHRIFSVSGNTTVEIHDLTLKNACARGGNGGNGGISGGGGGGGMGAALFVNHGKVYCENVEFIGNKVLGGAGGGSKVVSDDGTAGGGGFAGDGYSPSTLVWHSVPGGDGGFLGEEGKGGRSSGDNMCALNGGFGGGGGSSTGEEYGEWNYQAGHGGFGGGGGATYNYDCGIPGNGGLFGGAGNDLGSGGGGAGLGGAIFVRENAKLVLLNCSLTGNTAVGGSSPHSLYWGNSIPGNPGQGKGGAVFAMANAVVKVSNITFSGNTAGNPSVSETPAIFLGVQLDTNDFYGTFQVMDEDTTAFPPSAASNWPLYR